MATMFYEEPEIKGVKVLVGEWEKSSGITAAEATAVGEELLKIFNTERGAEYFQELQSGGDKLMIFLNDKGINAGLTYRMTLAMDL